LIVTKVVKNLIMDDKKSTQDEQLKIEAAIQSQESLLGSGVLPDEQIEATLEALRIQYQTYLSRLEGVADPTKIETGGGAAVLGDVDTAGGDFIVLTKSNISTILKAPIPKFCARLISTA
jgi:hypothetical protein